MDHKVQKECRVSAPLSGTLKVPNVNIRYLYMHMHIWKFYMYFTCFFYM